MPAFSAEQAQVLASVIFKSYDQLVHAADFHELKDIVKELGQSQQELTVEVKELATEVKGLSTEVKELSTEVKEIAVAQKQTEKEIRNLARQVGGLSEAFGGSLEDFAVDLVPDILEKYWGIVVEDAGRDALSVKGSDVEFDLVIRGKIAG